MTGTRRPVRTAALWVGGVLAALVLLIAVGEIIGWPFLRQPLQDALTRATGVSVMLDGRFRARLIFRPHMSLAHLNIAAAGGVQVPHLLDARGVELAWRWSDVWRWHQGGVLRVQMLKADSLDAQLVRGSDGRASWQIGGEPKKDAQASADPLGGLPRFGTLLLGNGLIVVDDVPLKTDLRIEVHGGEGDAKGTPQGYRASAVGRWQALPLNLQLATGGALPLFQDIEANVATRSLPLRIEGKAGTASILFDGQAGALLGERRLQGALRVRGPSLASVAQPFGVTLPQTPPFDLSGQLGHEGSVWHLQADRAAIGRSLLNGDFRFDSGASPPKLTGRLSGPRLMLADLGPSVGTSAPKASGGSQTAPDGNANKAPQDVRVLPDRALDLPSLRVMDADVQVAIDDLDFGSSAISPFHALRTHLLLQGGVLQLQSLQASVAGGQFSGSARLDSTVDPAHFATDLRFASIDLARWIPGLRTSVGREDVARHETLPSPKAELAAASASSPPRPVAYVTGTLDGRVQASGAGRSTAQVLGTLDGRAKLTLRDGTLSHLATEASGLDIAQAVGVWVRGDRPLPLRCARLDLAVKQGVATPTQAVIDNKDTTIRIGGHIDLRDESLALVAVAKPKDISPLTLRTPIHVDGHLGSPSVSLDKRLAGKLLGAVALGVAVGPLAALLPLIDPGSSQTTDPCTD